MPRSAHRRLAALEAAVFDGIPVKNIKTTTTGSYRLLLFFCLFTCARDRESRSARFLSVTSFGFRRAPVKNFDSKRNSKLNIQRTIFSAICQSATIWFRADGIFRFALHFPIRQTIIQKD